MKQETSHDFHIQVFGVTFGDGANPCCYAYAAPGDPAASYITTRSLIRGVKSPDDLVPARRLIDECVETHELCRSAVSPSPRLPRRLLDCSHPALPRLVSTTPEQCGVYLALSYVWGEDRHQAHKTTVSKVSEYEKGIDRLRLPSTIRDAIDVTHMLNFQWLWVDSLCIVQDSNEDTAQEVANMHHIYRYAHLTIIASRAKDVSEGFLQERPMPPSEGIIHPTAIPFILPPRPLAPIGCPKDHSAAQSRVGTMFVAAVHNSYMTGGTYAQELGPTSVRAWCLQEYLMSPRTLIFTPQTLMFRCLSTLQAVGDAFYQIHDDPRIPESLFLPSVVPSAAEPDSEEQKGMHAAWRRIMEEYTCRAASNKMDKLVACGALAKQFSNVLGSGSYRAGLWHLDGSDMLLLHLLWSAAIARGRPAAYYAPSWSWAAIEGIIEHPLEPRDLPPYRPPSVVSLAKVADCQVTLEDTFGRVESGTLMLRATLIPCRDGRAVRGKWDRALATWLALPSLEQVVERWRRGLEGLILEEEDNVTSTEPRTIACVTMDSDCGVDSEVPERMWLVPLVWTPNPLATSIDSRGPCAVHGIALVPAPTSINSGSEPEKHFRRIGHFESHFSVRHPLWDPVREMGEGLWTDIAIV